ncbi:MAG TPA: hypothetical protein VJB36_05145 [Methylomirabilota bacterium]|nr:hypothetical protein [Methylomirabilota bacterium]
MTMQLTPARLVQEAAAQAGPQHVQFGLAHRPLEAEPQPVVEMRGVIDAILVENERVVSRSSAGGDSGTGCGGVG